MLKAPRPKASSRRAPRPAMRPTGQTSHAPRDAVSEFAPQGASHRRAPKQAVIVDVIAIDDAHNVEIHAQGRRFAGEVIHSAGAVAIGDEIHIKVHTGSDDRSTLLLLGEINGWRPRRAAHSVPLLRGLEFSMLLHRATVRGHDVAPNTFVQTGPGQLPPEREQQQSRRATARSSNAGQSVAKALANEVINGNYEDFHVDDELDATEVLQQLSASGVDVDIDVEDTTPHPTAARDAARVAADIAFGFEEDDDDTIVMPQANERETSVVGPPSSCELPTPFPDDAAQRAFDAPPSYAAPDTRVLGALSTRKAPTQSSAHPRVDAAAYKTSEPPLEDALPRRNGRGSPEEHTGVSGRLETMSVLEVLQSLEVLHRTGRIDFSPSVGGTGCVFVEKGQVVHAVFSGLLGRDAVVELLQLETGRFRIRFDRTTPKKSIEMPTNFFLLDCVRSLDELRKDRERGPSTAIGPVPKPVRDRVARERNRQRARDAQTDRFHLAPPR